MPEMHNDTALFCFSDIKREPNQFSNIEIKQINTTEGRNLTSR